MNGSSTIVQVLGLITGIRLVSLESPKTYVSCQKSNKRFIEYDTRLYPWNFSIHIQDVRKTPGIIKELMIYKLFVFNPFVTTIYMSMVSEFLGHLVGLH